MTAVEKAVRRDRAWGRFFARKGAARVIAQAETGNGCKHDNVRRLAEWRNRYATVPLEQTLGKPVNERGAEELG